MKFRKSKKIDFKHNLNVYWGLLSKYKSIYLGILLISLLTQFTSLSEKLLFKIIVDRGSDFTSGILPKEFFAQILFMIIVIYLIVFIISAIAKWLYLHLINLLESRLILDLKKSFFNHILHLFYRFHTSHKTGSLISRLLRGSHGAESMTDVFVFNIVPLIFQLIVVSISLIYFDLVIPVVLLLVMVSFISYSLFIQFKQQSAHLAANQAEDIEKANIADVFTNIDSVKYFGKEELVKQKFASLAKRTQDSMLRNWNYFRYLDFGHTLILGAGTILMLYFPLSKFLNNQLSLGTLVFIYTLYGNIVGHMFGFVHGIRQFYRAAGDFQDLFKYAKIKNEVKDYSNAKSLHIKKGVIEFRNVSFKYNKKYIFRNFNLKIGQNEKVAIVGHSGSGKSTLIKLLYRLYDVEKGSILIDGKNIRHLKQESLRKELSVVPQECILFDESIYDNIAFSNQDSSSDDVFRAMKFAQLDVTVKNFPKKEKTIVGERGVKLSGGEKQRVSIARALLANKKILVLDEA